MNANNNDVQDLYIHDPEDGKTYVLKVNEDDYNRAQSDLAFANNLLFHAKCTNSQEGETAATTSEIDPDLENTTKNQWQYEEIQALINSVETHHENLNHPKKKKTVFENVSNDLSSSGFVRTADACSVKWRSLIRSYKAAKDNTSKTGRTKSRFYFFEQMDNILGNKPSIQCQHTEDSIDEASSSISESCGNDSSAESRASTPIAKKRRLSSLKIRNEELKTKEERHKENYEQRERLLAIEQQKVDLREILKQQNNIND